MNTKNLSPGQAAVATLHREGLTTPEIAKRAQLTERTVQQYLSELRLNANPGKRRTRRDRVTVGRNPGPRGRTEQEILESLRRRPSHVRIRLSDEQLADLVGDAEAEGIELEALIARRLLRRD